MSKALKNFGDVADFANKLIDRIFQLDRLDDLAKSSSIVRVALAEMTMLSN